MQPVTTLRVDPISGVEVYYAPIRASRSNAFQQDGIEFPPDEFCPFCPCHEHETPPETWRWPSESDLPWQQRMVPNRFPVVATGLTSPAGGYHEVLIESARHNDHWLSLSEDVLARVFQAITDRLLSWKIDPAIKCFQVFKNVGRLAGASLAHPHLQVMALYHLPSQIALQAERETHWVKQHGQSYTRKLLSLAEETQCVTYQDEIFVSLCPSISRFPYEVWLLPRKETPFLQLQQLDWIQLALHFQHVLKRMQSVLGVFAHNIVWRLPPLSTTTSWRIEIIPRLTTWAGLELGSGLYVNPVLPEQAARLMQS
jgi:UDPglucose--hexose-1-phosphate uridylyltransferase